MMSAPATIDWPQLHAMGFSLIPVRAGEKIPAIQWAPFKSRHATLDEIAGWAEEGHNAGIVTGAISGLVVLDCDSAEAVALAIGRGIPQSTISVRTARGCHFYFRHPGSKVPNKASLLVGMDIRGDGGFVVAPGSIHPSGARYEWADHPAWNEISPMPEWLRIALQGQPAEMDRSSGPVSGEHTAYGRSAMERELSILRKTKEGARNDQLNRSAYALAQLAAGGEIGAVEAQAALHDAALAIGLDPVEIEQTLLSGWESGWQEPRTPQRPAANSKKSPEIISARALLQIEFPALRWAIPGLLPEGLSILAGKPKLGKSFLSLQIAVAVSTGEGKALGVAGIDAGDVLVCALEDSQRRLKDRLTRMQPFGVPGHLHFATNWPRIGQGGIEALDAWCNDCPGTRLIILDTWRALKPAGTGRSSAYDEDAIAAAPLLELTKRRPGLAVVVIHHTRKSEADDVFDMISGTHGLTGIFDTLMVLARYGEGARLAAQGRDLEGYEKALERDRHTGGWVVKGDAVALAKTGERQELLDLLVDADAPRSLAELAKAVGKKPDTTRRLLKALVDEGSVQQPGHGLYALTPSQFTQSAQLDAGEEEPF